MSIAVIAIVLAAVSCGNKSKKAEAEVAAEVAPVEEAADSVAAAADSVVAAADTVVAK